MPKLKLTYFDIHGGRAEVARLALIIGGLPFEDERISFQQFGETQSSMPFNAVPILNVDDDKNTPEKSYQVEGIGYDFIPKVCALR